MAMQRQTWMKLGTHARALALLWVSLLALAACSSGGGTVQEAGGQPADPETDDYPIFYVKRYSVPTQQDDLRMLRTGLPSADLFMRSTASPAGIETNITAPITGTGTANAANYDIKDVSVSYDGSTVLFTMRGPLAAKQQQDMPPSWRIYQYVIATGALSPVINPATDPDPLTVNDVGPYFLPDGRIVFSTTRQRQMQAVLLDEGYPQFTADDEARTEPDSVLHVMNADGTDIHEISFNASHDRDPSVLMSGRVMWTRWDNAPGKDGMQLYTANPDGTGLQLLYGANSHQTGPDGTPASAATIEFVKAHEMQDGRVLALIRPYTGTESATAPLGTDFGGDLVIINTNDYVENTQALLSAGALTGPAQVNATSNNDVLTIPGPSPGGRYYAGFPLWDGTGRILVSWSECRLLGATKGTFLPCTAANLAAPNATDAPPVYSVWMFNPQANTMQPIMTPTDGIMITDLVAAQPRPAPAVILDQEPDVQITGNALNWYNADVGVIDIRSVYDFDGVDTATPNIATLANGATPATQRPARFIRLVKPVQLPNKKVLNLSDQAFGASDFMREILGYAPVEPDGSVMIEVPANVAFQMQILDANGQMISPNHAAWLQVQAGEVVQCNGCHTPAAQQNPAPGQTAKSHGRPGLFNSVWPGAAETGQPFPNSVPTFSPNQGETMAETRARTSCATDTPACLQMVPNVEVLYTDVWTNTNGTGLTANPPITLSYLGAAPQGEPSWFAVTTLPPTSNDCLAAWSSTCRIVVNYTEHVQPIWSKLRQVFDANNNLIADHTCNQAGCHAPTNAQGTTAVPAGQLDLTNNASTDEPLEFVSYRELLFGHNEQIVNNGVLVDVTVPGPTDPTTGQPTMVPVPVTAPMVVGSAQASALFFGRFAAGSGDSIHAGILSPPEMRLISEWLDIGAQYFNDPFDPTAPLN
jgi:hypothetical protein